MKDQIQDHSNIRSPRLQRHLFPVAQRLRNSRTLKKRIHFLSYVLIASIFSAFLGWLLPSLAEFLLIATLAGVGAAIFISWQRHQDEPLNFLEAAREVEQHFPELNASLITAVELELSGENSFLSRRVLSQALENANRESWDQVDSRTHRNIRIRYLATIGSLIIPIVACFLATKRASNDSLNGSAGSITNNLSIEISPGNVEIEKGSSLVVTARFPEKIPDSVSLVTTSDSGIETTSQMARSLSDPVFAYSLRRIEEGVTYQILYNDKNSESLRIDVFELPELVTADASLTFPDYTSWEDRTVEDTLRVSAIVGTDLQYRFNVNKPIKRAFLESSSGEQIELESTTPHKTQFAYEENLQNSDTLKLHLIDEEGRANPFPPEIRIDAIINQRPHLSLETPRGDQRFTAIQEVLFEGIARDDFGLLDYGIAFVGANAEIEERSLSTEQALQKVLNADISQLLALEGFGLQPKDSISWYLWAEDYGPDGTVRRSTGDLYFADIRAFDEIFREQDAGGSATQSSAASQGLELLEKQQRIAISIFRIKNSATKAIDAVEDLDIARQSQVEALMELEQLIPRLEKPDSKEIAMEAQRYMQGADLGLTNAVDEPSLTPLEFAWSDAQAAYQALVKLTEDEFNVSQSRNRSGSGSPSRNQAQINELDFRQEENRYETASQAQALQSPEERQDLELISKLNELSRRQDDMNQRLQDMQNALAQAQSDSEREAIERELKRLQEEQRQLLDSADEAIQQAGNRQSAQEARKQLENARDNMQRSSEQLDRGEVSQALASGTRAQDTLERTKEDLRNQNSSQFSEAMRQARSQARQLAESQKELQKELQDFEQSSRNTLDDSNERTELSDKIDEQARSVDNFLRELQEIAAGAESVEPKLFRDLYQVLRDSAGARFDNRYESSSTLLEQGFIDDARSTQRGLSRDLEQLSEAVAEAAEGVLGNEGATLEFAQTEIESLRQQLEAERLDDSRTQPQSNSLSNPSSLPSQNNRPTSSNSNPDQVSVADMVRDALAELQSRTPGPLTGGGFDDWIDRLSTVEALIEEPTARSRITEARETAENIRRDFKRHGEVPQWEFVENEISAPLNDVSSWLETEIRRIENPDALQRIDRDPVPDEYSEIVKRYYESLGN